MSTVQLTPYWHFFGEFVDVSMELEFLEDFGRRLGDLLAEAAAKPPSDLSPLPDSLAAIAGDRAYLYTKLYTPLVYQTFLISTVILLEYRLAAYARHLGDALGIGLSTRDIAGSELERFRTFCKKLANLDPAPNHWEDIRGIVEIRNCVIHNDSRLPDSPRGARIIAFAGRHGIPDIVDGRLKLGAHTPNIVLKVMRGFFDEIYGEALRRFPKNEA